MTPNALDRFSGAARVGREASRRAQLSTSELQRQLRVDGAVESELVSPLPGVCRLCGDGRAARRLIYDEFHKLINCVVGHLKTRSNNQFVVAANVGIALRKSLVALVGANLFAKLAKLITSCSLVLTALGV